MWAFLYKKVSLNFSILMIQATMDLQLATEELI
jgi:hypothetical protein